MASKQRPLPPLRPCPFCGEPGEYRNVQDWHGVGCQTPRCPGIRSALYHRSEEAAIATWNRRALRDSEPREIPAELFDGYSVYSALTDGQKAFVSPEAAQPASNATVALYVRRAPDPFAGNVSGEADALAAHAIEELHQLGYTVRDGRLIPPDNLGDLARIAGVLAGDGTGEALQPLPDSAYASDAKPIPDGAQLPEAVEACIACLGDDAAQIRNELANCRPNGEGFIAEEWADNMEEAARLLQAAYGVSVVSPAADPQRNNQEN